MTKTDAGPWGIRKLWPLERDAYTEHLLRLDPDSRRLRFGAPTSDATILGHAERCFGVDGPTYGLIIDGRMRAAGELHGAHVWPREAGEAAFSVESPWRRRGVGAALFRAIMTAARNRGYPCVVMACLPENLAMQALVRRHGGDLSGVDHDGTGRVRLATATPATLFGEWASDAGALLAARLRA